MVTRVWGKADSFELVFSSLGNDRWDAVVPADLEDGQYVVELYCEDDSGNRAYWTGILYLCNADKVSLRIIADKFKLWMEAEMKIMLKPESDVQMLPENNIVMKSEVVSATMKDDNISIIISECKG